MIATDLGVLFVHVPKCAGTFIEKYMTPNTDWDEIKEKHLSFEESIDKYGLDTIERCFRFAIVRNPYERLVSFFLYHQRKKSKLFNTTYIDERFRKFRTNYLNNFQDFVFNLRHYHHLLESWVVNDIAPCHQFIVNRFGLELDLVLKQEELKDGIQELNSRLNINLPNVKVNHAPSDYDYNEFYTEKEREFVQKYYLLDFHHYYPNHVGQI